MFAVLKEESKRRNDGMKEGVHNWFRRPLVRKLLAAVVVLALVAAGAVWWMNKKNTQAPILTNRIRTTRLQKTSLNESVIADGTIQSSNTSTVTTDQKYAVKEILVAFVSNRFRAFAKHLPVSNALSCEKTLFLFQKLQKIILTK